MEDLTLLCGSFKQYTKEVEEEEESEEEQEESMETPEEETQEEEPVKVTPKKSLFNIKYN